MPNSRNTFRDTRFLVIDRDKPVLKAVVNDLRLNGAAIVHAAESVQLGLDKLKGLHAHVDCIICAQDVTPISGIEFLKNVRCGKSIGAHFLPGTKFIMLTAHRERALVETALKLDINGYITKPFDRAAFTHGIHSALAHHIDIKPATDYFDVDISQVRRLPVWLSSAC